MKRSGRERGGGGGERGYNGTCHYGKTSHNGRERERGGGEGGRERL